MEQQLFEQITELRQKHPDLVVIIYWPTATGKSGLSLRLADLFATQNQWVEIISADSRQVYKDMTIGTDKISEADRERVPHYSIDLIDPDGKYTAHQRQTDTKKRISDIQSRGHIPFIVGGTGLYIDTIYKNFSLPPDVQANRERRAALDDLEQKQPWYCRALLNSFDPVTAAEFHPKNTRYIQRAIEIYEQTGIPKSVLVQENPVDHPLLMISLTRDVETANQLIHTRVEEMIERGLIAEVQWLLDRGYNPDLQAMNGIGYRQTVEWLLRHPEWSETESKDLVYNRIPPQGRDDAIFTTLINSITLASVQYAKRQRTRFRRYEKDAREHPKDSVFYMQIDMWL